LALSGRSAPKKKTRLSAPEGTRQRERNLRAEFCWPLDMHASNSSRNENDRFMRYSAVGPGRVGHTCQPQRTRRAGRGTSVWCRAQHPAMRPCPAKVLIRLKVQDKKRGGQTPLMCVFRLKSQRCLNRVHTRGYEMAGQRGPRPVRKRSTCSQRSRPCHRLWWRTQA
jgi:hypothetical protein